LNHPPIVEKLSSQYVPAALNLYKTRDEKSPSGELLRGFMKQKQMYQGMWIVDNDGKVLVASGQFEEDRKKWTRQVDDLLDEGIRKFGATAPRRVPEKKDLLPYRGKGVQEGGKVTLALSTRYVHQGKGQDFGSFDTIHLSDLQFAEFAPPKTKVGTTWTISKDTASQFSRALSVFSDQSHMPLPREVTDVQFVGTVAALKDGIATLTYTGRIAAVHDHTFLKGKTNSGKANLRGIAIYDVEKKEMRSLRAVLEGTYRNFQPYDKEDNPLAACVEWMREPEVVK
jgi:hypothetical protein